MTSTNPSDWSCPAWHSDWDAEWELERLRELANRFIGSINSRTAILEIIDEGYLRVAFYREQACLGVAYVNRAATKQNNAALYGLHFGCDDIELYTCSIDDAVTAIAAGTAPWRGDK